MIATIGVMIGCYIIARMIQTATPQDTKVGKSVVAVVNTLVIIVAVLSIIDLIASGTRPESLVR